MKDKLPPNNITPQGLSKAQHSIAVLLGEAMDRKNLMMISRHVKRLIDMNCYMFRKVNLMQIDINMLTAERDGYMMDANRLQDENFKLLSGQHGSQHYRKAQEILEKFYIENGIEQ